MLRKGIGCGIVRGIIWIVMGRLLFGLINKNILFSGSIILSIRTNGKDWN